MLETKWTMIAIAMFLGAGCGAAGQQATETQTAALSLTDAVGATDVSFATTVAAKPKPPAPVCGPFAVRKKAVISTCDVTKCLSRGGELVEDDDGVAWCCVASGTGDDYVEICDEIDPYKKGTTTLGSAADRPIAVRD